MDAVLDCVDKSQIIDERLKDLEANPDAGDGWDAVQKRLRKNFDDSQR